MKVWIVCEGEKISIQEKVQYDRMGILADYLSANGHDVVWWSSSFDHGSKKHLTNKTRVYTMNEKEKLILLYSPIDYKKNVSVFRIAYHEILAQRFKRLNEKIKQPDIIICSWPTQQFARECVRYGKKHSIPVIIDIRDEWPDYFLRVFPAWAKIVGKMAIFPLRVSAARTLREASAITGVIPATVQWGLRLAKREAVVLDRPIYIGKYKVEKDNTIYEDEIKWWEKLGVTRDTWNLCLVGTLSDQGDYETLICAAKKIALRNTSFKLVIAGDGDEKKRLEELAKDCPQIVFAGWINKNKINSLMEMSKVGAFSYKNTNGFRDSVSNKIVQYLSAGLPVISSLEGLSKQLLGKYHAGITYEEGNADDCARAIEYMMSHERERIEMGKNALKLFDENFDAVVVNKQFEELFYDILKLYHS